MRFPILLAGLLAGTAASAQTLDMSGDCPGAVAISVSGATPGATLAFLGGAAGEGSDVIGVGGCSGTVTGLAGMRFLTRVTADGAGNASFAPTVPEGRCDMPIQVLDTSACTLSNVDTAGGGGPIILDDVYASYESEGRMVHVFQSDSNAALDSYTTFCEEHGLEWYYPTSAPDAQLMVANTAAYDGYHTWVITRVPLVGGTLDGFDPGVGCPAAFDDLDGFTALRNWCSSFCNPEDYGLTKCWDGDHVYDWLVCQGPL
ncbi:MAG: hypothetical protein ACI8PZ_004187 [Myxococcota bacterium]|jgi:hypothetical protein